MTSLLGLLEQFDPATHEWPVYYNRLEVFFAANEIVDDRRVPVFLTLLGHKAYSTVQDLCMPDLPSTRTLAQLKTIMDNHYGPKVNIRAARTSFRAITQREGQSVADFITALRHGSINCQFAGQLEDNLLDQFIAGLHDKRIQSKLCQTDGLIFQRACEQANLMETTELEVKRMASNFAGPSRPTSDSTQSSAVTSNLTGSGKQAARPQNRQRTQPQSRPQSTTTRPTTRQISSYACYRCGLANHSPDNCFYRDRKCNACGMVGHKALVCRKRDRIAEKQSTQNRKTTQHSTNSVAPTLESANEQVDGSTQPLLPSILEHIGGEKQRLVPPIQVRVLLNEYVITLDVDTGSPITVITERVWREVLTSPHLVSTNLAVHSYSGHTLKILGAFEGCVQFKGRRETLTCYVASGTQSCLFGRDAIKKFDIDLSIGHLKSIDVHARVSALLEKHKALFTDELGHVSV